MVYLFHIHPTSQVTEPLIVGNILSAGFLSHEENGERVLSPYSPLVQRAGWQAMLVSTLMA